MAGGDTDKTEKPTEKRLREARKEGQIARTQDAPTWVGIAAGIAMLPMSVAATGEQARKLMFWRNHLIANWAWTDAKGRNRKGFEHFPWMRIGMPLLVGEGEVVGIDIDRATRLDLDTLEAVALPRAA